jgi:hypothetical protein
MSALFLPPLDAAATPPQIKDAQACAQWLAGLPLTNIPLARSEIARELDSLNRFPLPARERLKIVEQLRPPVAYLQDETAKKYLDKPLPLGPAEEAAWQDALGLWQSMGTAYLHCLRAWLEGDDTVAEYAALIAQRCLHCTGAGMLEHYRTYRQVAEAHWRSLHALYAIAEERGLTSQPVKDSLNSQTETSTCDAAYAKALLTHLANPCRLAPKQFVQMERWLDKWAIRTPIVAERPTAPPLSVIAVDLDGASGPLILNEQQLIRPRYLDNRRLASTIRKRVKLLRKGESPAEAGLGEDCIQPGCEIFLTSLYNHWCEVAPARAYRRRPGSVEAQLCFSIPAMHFYVSGEKLFKQPESQTSLGRREMEDMRLFGRVSERTEKQQAAQHGFSLETWQIEDESVSGFRLFRPSTGGEPLSHNQLVAIRPTDGKHFVLGTIRWLMLTAGGEPQIGTRTLPGVPLAIAARPEELNPTGGGKFVPAFLLPGVVALNEPSSLVLPSGWFAPGKQVEVLAESMMTVKLHALLEKGTGYERVSFTR